MKTRILIKTYFKTILFILLQCLSFAYAQNANEPLKIDYQNNTLIITNHSKEAINLRNIRIQFNYFGKIFNVLNTENPAQKIIFFRQAASSNNANQIYTIQIDSEKNVNLAAEKSLKLALVTDKKDAPNNLKAYLGLSPINVQVAVANSNWVETISICNISGASVPLKNIEFDFNYSVPMPTTIWGKPFANWKVASQIGTAVVLTGGTAATPDLPSDPGCLRPLTIKFNTPPQTPAPTGPFVFKSDIGSTTLGNLNVNLAASPAAGLSNPTISVSGPGVSLQQVVNWGTTWAINNTPAGTYTISGNTITNGGNTYSFNPVNAVVTAGTTTNQNIAYTAAQTTTAVTVTLTNPPSAQVPVNFTGSNHTVTQNVGNGSVVLLANDTYNISSNIAGYNATATPNPLVVPNNTNLNITYTAVVTGNAGDRHVNFVNQCPFPVWFGFISGATPSKNGGGACNSDADCYPGNVCVNRGGGGTQCFWKNPVPANNNYQLAANGGTNSVTIPYVNVPMNAVFSGAAAGRTNCQAGGKCETGDCSGGTGGCPNGKGFMQPATQAEFTFNTKIKDFYDIETVNGINIPVAMTPTNGAINSQDPYTCGAPGSDTSTSQQLGACGWNFTPPIVEYNWVRPGGNACSAASDCQAGTICGLSMNPGKTPYLQKTCGKLLGYWNANQICGTQKDYGAPFNCQQKLPPPQDNYNMINLLGCAPIDSCYKNGAPNTCCGCANWDQLGIPVPPSPYTKQCVNSNPTWTSAVLPGLTWIKKACPSVYTYPFDDMSSTFVCQVMKDRSGTMVNSVDYTITFCPGGKTGGV